MSPDEFQIKLNELSITSKALINHTLPVIVGKIAVDFYKESFQNEGFKNQALVKWAEVQRRGANGHKVAKGARGTRKILTGNTGDLGESIEYEAGTATVKIKSDLVYAEAHNKGTTTAGRGNKTTIP